MNGRILNLGLAAVWGLLAVGLSTRHYWMDPETLQRVSFSNLPLLIALLYLLAGWNVTRFAAARWRRPHRESAEVSRQRAKIRSITGTDPKVTNPEFSFDRPNTPNPE